MEEFHAMSSKQKISLYPALVVSITCARQGSLPKRQAVTSVGPPHQIDDAIDSDKQI
jgi:hypothetical protein